MGDPLVANSIVSLTVSDIRFPTSEQQVGSDATNTDPDYSAAYLILRTASGHEGHGLVFTIGRGNDLCCKAIESMRHLVVGRDFDEIRQDFGRFWNDLQSDSQLRWLGPEKGVVHMAAGAIANAIWDLWGRVAGKPVWRLVCEMSSEELLKCLNLRYVSDVLSHSEALELLREQEAGTADRIRLLEARGYPAYTTSAGWLGYDDAKIARLCREARDQGFSAIKLKVGRSLEDDVRRCRVAREAIGPDMPLMIDANQVWEVDQAIHWIRALSEFEPSIVEEPTSPDDVLGHLKVKQAINGIKVATGEHCQNRVLFKQFIESGAIDVVQVDACRLAGLNEMLTVALIAAKYGKPVVPHAGGVGLCEYVQHFSMIDFVRISGSLEERMIEYVDHLHEHFENPCRIVSGAYMPPESPGFSIKMLDDSRARYAYPDGPEWQQRNAGAA